MLATVVALCNSAGLTSPALLEVVRGHMPTTTKSFGLPPLVLLVLVALAASLIMMAVVLARPAQAASLTVTTPVDELNDDGDCSLREAIQAADSNAAVDGCAAGSNTELDTIVFAVGQEATISLSSELDNLLITDDAGLTINGQQNEITISGEDAENSSGAVFRVEPGAVFNLRSLTVADSHSSTFAGALLNNGGEVEVRSSTFSGNSATDNGGAIENDVGPLTVINSTFSGNSAGGAGGAILNVGGPLTVTNSTFSGNSAGNGGGIFVEGSTATLKNTIVANSTLGGNCTEGNDGTIADGGYNIDDADTCGFSASNNSQPSTDPKLDALADNGGPTQTHALRPASPAINAIPSATNGCGTDITTDQRRLFNRPQGGKCEIGSFEDSSPRVTRVVPVENATGVAPATNINAYFSEAMRANTINANTVKLFKVGTTTPIGAQVSYDAVAKRAIMNPNANLELGTRYRALVTTGARDLPSNRLDQDLDPSNGLQQKVWFFTVRN